MDERVRNVNIDWNQEKQTIVDALNRIVKLEGHCSQHNSWCYRICPVGALMCERLFDKFKDRVTSRYITAYDCMKEERLKEARLKEAKKMLSDICVEEILGEKDGR